MADKISEGPTYSQSGSQPVGKSIEKTMGLEDEKRELLRALEACLQKADDLGLVLVGIHVSHAIDILCTPSALTESPTTRVG